MTDATRYARAAIDRELATLAATGIGGRELALYAASAALGNFAGSGMLGEDQALELLVSAAMQAGLPEPQARATARRGLKAGMRTPRLIPNSARLGMQPANRSRTAVPLPPRHLSRRAVETFWNHSNPVTEDESARAWLAGRALDADSVELWDLARVTPLACTLPSWARSAKGSWLETSHRLVLRGFTATGEPSGLRARALDPAAEPKALAPSGFSTAGLVYACGLGQQLLRGDPLDWWKPEIVIVEGIPDFLTWTSQQPEGNEHGPAVFGIESGAWTAAHAARIPDGARVAVRTHLDAAGDKYAQVVAESFMNREVQLFRPRRAEASS